ncbi:lipase family protein [Nocardia sp. 348MFTsu5.1]|uniref:lipase family protein n=1 Tax=Nocardia sp. 348MFTsu5.1 TaxID=1172185 RepID=UPI00048C6B01|nr:lipase family protein [Nocardia sp. 348MFTsu5.1]
MSIAHGVGPTLDDLRPIMPSTSSTFPVYADLVDKLVAPEPGRDPVVAHALAVASGYAYSDGTTIATMMARMGLPESQWLGIEMTVDAMFIRSTAYLIQSADGRVVILAYRGTEPTNLVSWLTDADVYPDKITIDFDNPDDPTEEARQYDVHAGFYRNVRATRFEIAKALNRALRGESIRPGPPPQSRFESDDHSDEAPTSASDSAGPMPNRMETLYITGHSLGGAMASMLTVMVRTLEPYSEIASKLKGTYTFGAPMIGEPALARASERRPDLGPMVYRYVYDRDPVPQLPPTVSGEFAHFGSERRYRIGDGWADVPNSTQASNPLRVIESFLAFAARQFSVLRWIPFQVSINDHLPHNYITAITPPGVPNEFGDAMFADESVSRGPWGLPFLG